MVHILSFINKKKGVQSSMQYTTMKKLILIIMCEPQRCGKELCNAETNVNN